LENGCIPIFYGEPCGEGILDDKGLLFQRYFSKSALKKAEEQILHMNTDDLALQLRIIEKSLNFESGDVHGTKENGESLGSAAKAEPHRSAAKAEVHWLAGKADKKDAKAFADSQELIKEAEIIYEELMADRIQAPDGDYSWMTSQYNAKTGGSRVGLMSGALYDGLLGIAVFTGALHQITGKPEYKKTSDHCINKTIEGLESLLPVMERYQVPLGYGSGVGGFISGLSAVVQYTENQKAEEIRERLLLKINNAMISSDPWLDVLGGTAGLVVALTKNWDSSDESGKGDLIGDPKYEDSVRQILEWCGSYLLERRTQQTEEGYLVWNSKDSSQPLTGLGHGMSGIALALMKIYRVIGGSEYLEAAQEAVAYETSVFSEHACNWPDFRRPQQTSDPAGAERSALPKQNEPVYRFMNGYCSGAPGVGLSRLSMLSAEAGDHEFLESLRKDISRTDRFIKEYSKEPRDHLCCGRIAGIDFLIEESLALEDKSSLDRAKGMMKMLLDDKKEHGRFCILKSDGEYLYNPTLFQGTAGIAYEMLRLAAPEKIRSILI
jgi:type 2 lantibiotic biosynthesis protein LanM